MTSNFRLQIVHAKDGVVVEWLPGAKIETDLVRELVYRLQNRGVGVFKTQATVLKAVEEEFAALLWELKKQV